MRQHCATAHIRATEMGEFPRCLLGWNFCGAHDSTCAAPSGAPERGLRVTVAPAWSVRPEALREGNPIAYTVSSAADRARSVGAVLECYRGATLSSIGSGHRLPSSSP